MRVRAGIRLRPSVLERHPVPRRGVEASIRSIAYTNAFATRPALPPLPARVLPNALLLVLFLFSRSTGSPTRTVHAPSSVEGVYTTEGSAYPAVSSAEILWHRRLEHGNFRGIRELSRLGVVRGLNRFCPKKVSGQCDDCLKEKHHKFSLHSKHIRGIRPGEIIHSDVSRKMSVPSVGGSLYFLTSID